MLVLERGTPLLSIPHPNTENAVRVIAECAAKALCHMHNMVLTYQSGFYIFYSIFHGSPFYLQNTIHADFKASQLCEFGRDIWKLIDFDSSVLVLPCVLVSPDRAMTTIFAAPEATDRAMTTIFAAPEV